MTPSPPARHVYMDPGVQVSISIRVDCDHTKASSLLGGTQEQLRNKFQVGH